MANKYKMTMMEPALVDLVSPTGQTVTIDLYESHQLVIDANNEPTQDAKWDKIKQYIATKIGCTKNLIAQNQAVNFNNDIIKLTNVEIELAKKNYESIVSSRQSIQESQTTI